MADRLWLPWDDNNEKDIEKNKENDMDGKQKDNIR